MSGDFSPKHSSFPPPPPQKKLTNCNYCKSFIGLLKMPKIIVWYNRQLLCSRDGCTCMGCTYIAGCWRLEREWPCPVICTCCVYQLCFMLAGPWQGWHVVLRSMCQWVLLLGHYRVLKAAQLKSGMTIYVMYIILHYVTPILSAVCSTRCRLPATAGSIACMCYILAHVYLFHRPWPPIHRHCCTPAEATHKDTHT